MFNVPFQHKYQRRKVYHYPVTSTLAAFLFSSHPKMDRVSF